MQGKTASRRETLIEVANRFLGERFAPVPCPPLGTTPVIAGWQSLRLTGATAGKHFAEDDNIGLLLGEPSDGLVVVEFKCDDAKMLARERLLRVRMISGRASAPESNWWFQVLQPPARSRRFDDPTREKPSGILELKSTGEVVLVPPSIYPGDREQGLQEEACEMMPNFPLILSAGRFPDPSDFEPMSMTDLEAELGAIAATVLLARAWSARADLNIVQSIVKLLQSEAWSASKITSFGKDLAALTRDDTVNFWMLLQLDVTGKPIDQHEEWKVLSNALGPAGIQVCRSLSEWLIRSEQGAYQPPASSGATPIAWPPPYAPPAPPPADVRATARWLIERGFAPVPLAPRSTEPVSPDWQDQRVTSEQVDTAFASDANIGVLLGAPSNGLVVVELMCLEAQRAASGLLPPMAMTSGRVSTPESHCWFVVDQPPPEASQTYCGPDLRGQEVVLLEFRSTGAVAVAPPSRISTPEQPGEEGWVWSMHEAPKGVGCVERSRLEGALREVAAAALLAKSWPRGATMVAGQALAELLLSAGWDDEHCKRFLIAVCSTADDRKIVEYIRIISNHSGSSGLHPDWNWATLAQELGPHGHRVCAQIGEWLSIPVPESVAASVLPPGPTVPPPPPPGFDWPAPPDDSAFRGLAGEFVNVIDPATEADRVAVLGQFLVYFGSIIGRSAFFAVEADRHYANENLVLVGATSKGRKGTSHAHVHRMFEAIDREWAENRVISGIASGAGLISAVRDPVEKTEMVRKRGKAPRMKKVTTDPGEHDKRLLAYEPEFVRVLAQIKRADNSLSPLIRQAWESSHLKILTKNSPLQSTGAHVSIIGHITEDELLRHLNATETANGFGNRFIWLVTRRSKLLPHGMQPDQNRLQDIQTRLRDAIEFARGTGEVRRDAAADDDWKDIYAQLAADRPGLSGCLLGRAEAHTMRLALIYALLDRCTSIGVEHLRAAQALWGYAERSVRHVFGDSLGDPLADRLLQSLRSAALGMTTTEISNCLGRNVSSQLLRRALSRLLQYNLVKKAPHIQTGGRPSEHWLSVQ